MLFATPLTQQHRRLAKGRPAFAEVKTPTPEPCCRGCGKKIPTGSIRCGECNLQNTKEHIVEIARIGRITAHSPAAVAKQAATQRRHGEERRQWNPSEMPAWLTPEAFLEKVHPVLAKCQRPLSRGRSEFRSGTLAGFGRATARTRGTGNCSHSL